MHRILYIRTYKLQDLVRQAGGEDSAMRHSVPDSIFSRLAEVLKNKQTRTGEKTKMETVSSKPLCIGSG